MPSTTASSLDSLQITAGVIVAGLLALLVQSGFQRTSCSSAAAPIILGEVEIINLEPIDFPLEARIDTGADLSSLDARGIHEFTGAEAEKWVRFEVEDRLSGSRTPICLPVVRHVEIKRHKKVNHQCRPVVRLPVTLGEMKFTTEFTLIDRSNFRYPVLLGRQDIQNRALVDVSLNHTRANHNHSPQPQP